MANTTRGVDSFLTYVGERMLEDFHFLEAGERFKIGRKVQHQPMLDVEKHVARDTIVAH